MRVPTEGNPPAHAKQGLNCPPAGAACDLVHEGKASQEAMIPSEEYEHGLSRDQPACQ